MIRRPLLEHARLYARHGLRVFPCARLIRDDDGRLTCSCPRSEQCQNPGKHPLAAGWQDVEPRLFRWWGMGGLWNVGIVTGAASGIVVLDIDPRHGGDETLADLEERHGRLPPTWRFLTGGGGEHVIFRHPGAHHYIPNNASGVLGAGLDIRGDGGLIIGPPSLHVSGKRYRIDPDHHPDDVPLAALPAWLLDAITPPPPPVFQQARTEVSDAYIEAAIRAAAQRIGYASHGARNDTLNREAYSLARFVRNGKLSEGELVYRLAYAAASAGLATREITTTIRSALRARR